MFIAPAHLANVAQIPLMLSVFAMFGPTPPSIKQTPLRGAEAEVPEAGHPLLEQHARAGLGGKFCARFFASFFVFCAQVLRRIAEIRISA